MGKVVLAYSGGLDTSVAIVWLREQYRLEVVTVTADVGDHKDVAAIRQKALDLGASEALVVDARREFAAGYAFRALRAQAVYQGRYPLSAALSRPLIARLLVETARKVGAEAIAHGCTGKGNDQVRFDVATAALAPDLRVIAPVREWAWSREEEIEYALERGIPVPATKKSPYSIDQNLWGRSVECGVLEDPWAEPPDDVWAWTCSPDDAPAEPEYVEVGFDAGTPVSLDGRVLPPEELVAELNRLAGRHGVGRIDMIEDRLVGIKSREVYEAPAATVLLQAHRELEGMCLPRETLAFKALVADRYAELAYFGLWYAPLREALDAFVDATQAAVTGVVRVKLHRGSCQVVGRKAPKSLYQFDLATYDRGDRFDHRAAEGFIALFGLPTRVWAQVQRGGTDAPSAGKSRQPAGKAVGRAV